MANQAALGWKLHTGWALLVAVAGRPDDIRVLFRRRVELLPTASSVSRFVYHQASEMAPPKAKELVESAMKAGRESARLAVHDAIAELQSRGIAVNVCGVLCGAAAPSQDLAAIRRSHPLIHAAEGALFQKAIVSACENSGLEVVLAREREVWSHAAAGWDITETEFRKNVDLLRKSPGAPWSADYKASTAIAFLALKSHKMTKSM
jgi:hypothetical protein